MFRSAKTLSGGESQRIRLATQIGSQLVGVMYILDEPSIGLHQRDNMRLIKSLCDLRDNGNSVIVVEHDKETIEAADYVIDIGPGAGINGGKVVAQGNPKTLKHADTLTAQYLNGVMEIGLRDVRKGNGKTLTIKGAQGNNLKHIDVNFPLGGLSPISYLWDNGSTLSGLINIPNGTYTVTVTDAINCSVSATAVIVKVPAVLTSINITPDTCSHALGSIALNVWQGTAPYTYQWQPNVSNNAQAVNLTAGSYQILVTDINTCTQSIHTTVGDAGNINVSIGADTLICDTFNLQLMPGNYDTYLWQDGSSANTFHANTAGTYTVTVTEGTCTTSTSVQIFNDCNETLYIPNAFSPNEDGLNDRFIIETGLTTAYTLQIYNRYGALIFETQNSESGWNGLDGSKIVQSDLYGFVLQYTKFGRKSKLVTGTVRVIP